MDLTERAALFETYFEMYRDRNESDTGYQRRSVIRCTDWLRPRLAFRTIGADRTAETLPVERTLD